MATTVVGSTPAAPRAHAWTPENAALEFIAVLVDRIYVERANPSYNFYNGKASFAFNVVQWVSLVALCVDDAVPSDATQQAVAYVVNALKPPVAFRGLLLNTLCAAAPVIRSSLEKMRVLSASRARALYPSHLLHSVEVHAAFAEVARGLGVTVSHAELLVADVLRNYLETMDAAVHRRSFVFPPRSPVATSQTAPVLVPATESGQIDPHKLPPAVPPQDNSDSWTTHRPFDAMALGELSKVCAEGSVELAVSRRSARANGGVAVHGALIVASYFESADWIARRLGVDLANTRLHPASCVAAAECATFVEERNAAGEVRVVCAKWAHAVHCIVGLARARRARTENSWQPSLVPVLLSVLFGLPADAALDPGRVVVQQLVVFVMRGWIFGGRGDRVQVQRRRRFELVLRFADYCTQCDDYKESPSDAEAVIKRACRFAAYFGDELAAGAEYWLPVSVARHAALAMRRLTGTEKAVGDSLLATLPMSCAEPAHASQPPPAVRVAPDAVDVLYYFALSGRAPVYVREAILSEMRLPLAESSIFAMCSTAGPAKITAAYYVGTKNKENCFPTTDPRRRLAVALHEAELLRRGSIVNVDRIWSKRSPVPVGMSVLSSFDQLAGLPTRTLIVPNDYVIGKDARANAWPAHLLAQSNGQAPTVKLCYLSSVVFVSPEAVSDSLVTYIVPVCPVWMTKSTLPSEERSVSGDARRAWLRDVLFANILPQTPSPPEQTRSVDDERFLHKLVWDELCENIEYLREGENWRKRVLEHTKATRDINKNEGRAAVKRRRFTAEEHTVQPRSPLGRRLTEYV